MSSLHARPVVLRMRTHFTLSVFIFFPIFASMLRFIFVSADCGNMQVLETGGISCSLIKDIVGSHNELRQAVAEGLVKDQPMASSMREFYWDEELANGAQEWANQCTFAHNEDKDREVARFQVGQNLALSKSKREHPSTEKDFRKQITNWFDEHRVFKFGPILNLEDLQTVGHYTQIVWASTYLVGCGFSRYKSSSNVTHRLYVCHYGPTGNELNQEPYEKWSQQCPKNLVQSKKYPKLCSLKKSPANPCRVKSKRRNTHVDGNTRVDTEGTNSPGGRRFFTKPPANVEASDNRDESKKQQQFDVMQHGNEVILNVFANFW